MNTTPLSKDSDTELREKLKALKPHTDDQLPLGDLLSVKETDAVMSLFNLYATKRETLARIDELDGRLKVQFIPSHWNRLCGEVNSWAKYVDRRITELQATLEKDS